MANSIDNWFIGESRMSLDAKGRLTLPASMMKVLKNAYPDHSEALMTAPSPDSCIELLPFPLWEEKAEELKRRSLLDRNSRHLHRYYVGLSNLATIDNANRIRMPQTLMEKKGLGREVVVVGRMDFVEVWDLQTWIADLDEGLKKMSDMAQSVSDRD